MSIKRFGANESGGPHEWSPDCRGSSCTSYVLYADHLAAVQALEVECKAKNDVLAEFAFGVVPRLSERIAALEAENARLKQKCK